MTKEFNVESHVTVKPPNVTAHATLTYDESLVQIRENLAETERVLDESQKNKEAIDAWLNRRASDQ
jgi:hypothetical protein